jgi:hypothetical protein
MAAETAMRVAVATTATIAKPRRTHRLVDVRLVDRCDIIGLQQGLSN